MHVRRIRCHYCSRRVPADSIVCPICKHNPRGFYLRPRLVFPVLAVIAIVALAYWAINSSIWSNAVSNSVANSPTSTTTPRPTRLTALIVTATLLPSRVPVSTDAPTASPTGTAVPTSTQIPTPTLTPQPSRPTALPVQQPLPTLAPSPTSYAPPVLLSPLSGARLSGRKQAVVLTYAYPQILLPNNWFRVEVIFKDPAGNFANWCGWTKDYAIRFPIPYYDDSWPYDRTFRWHVAIAQAGTDLPSTCQASYSDVSALSQDWIFYWY